MKEELYGWMRSLAVFYILLTCILHLVPDEKYQRYIRFFMGLVLTVMLCAPVFSIFGASRDLLGTFQVQYEEEELLRQQREWENIQAVYLWHGYEAEMERQIREALGARGIYPRKTEVSYDGAQVEAVLWFDAEPDENRKGEIADGLMEACGIGEGAYEIKILESGEAAVAGDPSAGTAAGGGAASGVG